MANISQQKIIAGRTSYFGFEKNKIKYQQFY